MNELRHRAHSLHILIDLTLERVVRCALRASKFAHVPKSLGQHRASFLSPQGLLVMQT